MSEEFLSRCVVDIISRKIHIYSDQGNERTVECESVDEFMNVLGFIKSQVKENIVFYSELL